MYERTVAYNAQVDPTVLATHLAHCLIHKARAGDVRIDGNRVEFSGGPFRFVTGLNPLVAFGHGEIEVDPRLRVIRYRLSFAQLLTLATATIALAGVFMLTVDPRQPTLRVFLFLPFAWAWVVGGNLLFGLWRFRNFIEEAIAPRSTSEVHR